MGRLLLRFLSTYREIATSRVSLRGTRVPLRHPCPMSKASNSAVSRQQVSWSICAASCQRPAGGWPPSVDRPRCFFSASPSSRGIWFQAGTQARRHAGTQARRHVAPPPPPPQRHPSSLRSAFPYRATRSASLIPQERSFCVRTRIFEACSLGGSVCSSGIASTIHARIIQLRRRRASHESPPARSLARIFCLLVHLRVVQVRGPSASWSIQPFIHPLTSRTYPPSFSQPALASACRNGVHSSSRSRCLPPSQSLSPSRFDSSLFGFFALRVL